MNSTRKTATYSFLLRLFTRARILGMLASTLLIIAVASNANPHPGREQETAMSPTLWSFQPVRRSTVPTSAFDGFAANAVDRFVFRKLQDKGLRPSPPADRLTLIRRVT